MPFQSLGRKYSHNKVQTVWRGLVLPMNGNLLIDVSKLDNTRRVVRVRIELHVLDLVSEILPLNTRIKGRMN